VVSKPAANRLVLDAGSKTLSSDGARGFTPAPGYGVVLAEGGRGGETVPSAGTDVRSAGTSVPASPDDTLLIERLSEEHAVVKALTGATPLEPGDLVRIVPNHSCVVSNLVDVAWLVNHDVATPLPIAARGRIA
jgi:D-serine deaminase-like pyridoxal phosphate-dependent protein